MFLFLKGVLYLKLFFFSLCGTLSVIEYRTAYRCLVSISAPTSSKGSNHCPLCHNNFMPGEQVRFCAVSLQFFRLFSHEVKAYLKKVMNSCTARGVGSNKVRHAMSMSLLLLEHKCDPNSFLQIDKFMRKEIKKKLYVITVWRNIFEKGHSKQD